MTLSSLYHTRKQSRIKNLLFWDYCMNFPPSIMKGFCFPVSRSSSTMLSKYIVPHPLTVTIVTPFDSGEIRRQVKKEVASDCTICEIFMPNMLFPRFDAQILMICLLLTTSPSRQFLFYCPYTILVSFGIDTCRSLHMLCPASGITNIPLQNNFERLGMGKNKTKRQSQCFGELLFWYTWELNCVCLLHLF